MPCVCGLVSSLDGCENGRLRPRHCSSAGSADALALLSHLPSPPPSLARFLFYDNAMFIINWFWDVLAQLGAPHVANFCPGMPHSLRSVQAFCTRTPKSSSSGSTMLARRYVCVVLAV